MEKGTSITDPVMVALFRHLTIETGLHAQACSGLIVGRGRKMSVIVRDELKSNGWEGPLPRNLKELLTLYQEVLVDTYRGAVTLTIAPRCGCVRGEVVESNLY